VEVAKDEARRTCVESELESRAGACRDDGDGGRVRQNAEHYRRLPFRVPPSAFRASNGAWWKLGLRLA